MNKADLLKMPKQTATRKMLKIAAKDKPVIEKYKFYGNTYERRSQENWLYLRSIVDGDILKLSCFLAEPLREKCKTPEYEIYLDRKERTYLTYVVNEDKWLTACFDRLPWPSYHYNAHGIIYDKHTGNEINAFFGTSYTGNDITQGIRQFQQAIMKDRLEKRHRKITDPWDEDLKQTRALPKDWKHWVDKVGIPEQYIFYNYAKRKYVDGYCTYCEQTVKVQPHHNEFGVCPHCHRKVQFKSLGKFKYHHTDYYIVHLLQKCKDGFMIRIFEVGRKYTSKNYTSPEIWFSEHRRVIGNKEGIVERAYYHGDYCHREYRWIRGSMRSYSKYFDCAGKVYGKSLPCLDKSCLRHTGFMEMYRELGYKIDPECYLGSYMTSPYIEKLVKADLTQLAKEVLGIRDRSCSIYASIKVDKTQTSLTKMLRLSPEELRRLRSCNGGKHMLLWLQYEKAIGQRIPDETIKWMLSHDMLPEKLKFTPPQMSVEQIHHYLQRNMQREKMRLSEVITTWTDYLSMAARLGYDLNDEIIYRTNKLKLRHDQLVEIIEKENMMLQAGEILRDYPHVEEHMRSVKASYEYGDENYTVLVPDRIEDILNEGRNLHHCVDKQDRYWDRLERKESYVFFLRRTNNIEQSYYTLEVEPGGTIRQKRTMYDRQEDDIEEATEFLKKWQKEIRKRLTKEDYALAEKSRILRLENFKQLRKDNVIINTGHLQGAKLVDVLMADLMVAA